MEKGVEEEEQEEAEEGGEEEEGVRVEVVEEERS